MTENYTISKVVKLTKDIPDLKHYLKRNKIDFIYVVLVNKKHGSDIAFTYDLHKYNTSYYDEAIIISLAKEEDIIIDLDEVIQEVFQNDPKLND